LKKKEKLRLELKKEINFKMAKKKVSDDDAGMLGGLIESRITAIVNKAIEEKQEKVSKEEVKEIVSEIREELDKIVSDTVKKHFNELAKFIIENF
jgi:hypothetical protein